MPGVHLADVPHAMSRAAVPPAATSVVAAASTRTREGDRPAAILDGGAASLPEDYPRTLRQGLVRAVETAPERGITFLLPDGGTDRLTYRRLLRDAGRVLGGLRDLGCQPGDPVIFQFEANRPFITTFWACVLGGFLPTPIAPVSDHSEGLGAAKLRNAWDLLERPVIVTDLDAEKIAIGLRELWPADVAVAGYAVLVAYEHDPVPYESTPDSPVLNLLTSGSTGMPKCVQHKNRSIVARTWGDCRFNQLTADEVTLCSMPMDHVMGCVMAHVRDVFLTCEQVNVKAEMFAARPVDWLDWIDRYRVTNLAAPNFAFALVNEYAGQIAAGDWDLSSLRTIYNAGEPVNSATAHAFLRMLEPYGLPHDAMVPCWGMSETASGVTHSRLSRVDTTRAVVAVDKDSLSGDLGFVSPQAPGAVLLTGVGAPLPGVVLRIVDGTGAPVPEGRIGQLEITGVTMMAGYHANPTANAESRSPDGWFKTGDLAFVHRGGLFIAGRTKDLIIVNGVNYLCHDIEAVVTAVAGVAPTAAAACGMFDPEIGTDRLIVFYVPDSVATQTGVVRAIRSAVSARTGLIAHAVIPIAAQEFPRTTSGKIQRGQLLARHVAGEFDALLRDIEVASEGAAALPAWFLAPTWVPGAARGASSMPPGVCLVLADDPKDPFVAALRERHPGTTFVVRRPPDDQDYHGLLGDVDSEHGAITAVVHALTLTPCPGGSPREGLSRGVLSVVRLVQAMVARGHSEVDLLVVTRLTEAVNAALTGLVRTLADERPVGSVRLVDLGAAGHEALAADELGRTSDVVVAYSGGQRMVGRLEPVPVPGPPVMARRPAFPRGGLLLVTGGLGGIGRLLAAHLVRAYDAKLLLVGRSPAAEAPANGAPANGATANGAVANGATADYVQCDVTDADQLREAVAQAEARWNRPLAGVLHLAGEPLRGQWDDLDAHRVARVSVAGFEAMLAAKVLGAYAIARLLDERPEASLVLFSSVNGWFGGSGFGAYACASSFLDGFAAQLSARGRDVQALAWSQWSGIGMNAGAPTTAAAAARGFRPISAERGVASLTVARAIGVPHLLIGVDASNPAITPELADRATRPAVVVVFTGDPQRLGEVETVARRAVDDSVPLHAAHVASLPAAGSGAAALARLAVSARDGASAEPPRPGLEARIAEIWCELLGHGFIGRDQSFFEMGGTSLLLARVQRQMTQRLGLRVPLRGFYRAPTISAVASSLAAAGPSTE